MTIGTDLIAAERARQIEALGYTAENDDKDKPGAFACAAIRYASVAGSSPDLRDHIRARDAAAVKAGVELSGWPAGWSASSFKMGDGNTSHHRVRELVKAGALIAAEIDRMHRQIAAEDKA